MISLIALAVVVVALLAAAFLLDKARWRAYAADEWTGYSPVAPLALATCAVVLAIGGATALCFSHTLVAPQTVTQLTSPLMKQEGGIYVSAEGSAFRYVSFEAPDESGWAQTYRERFDDVTVHEGPTPHVVMSTTVARASALWPWDVEVSRAFDITVPADGITGYVFRED